MADARPARTDLGAYAAGRLDPMEHARLRRALAEDPRLAAEAAELGEVASLLARTAPARPPDDLEARTLARVAAAAGAGGDGADELGARRAAREARRGRRRPTAAVAAAALAALAVAFGGGVLAARDPGGVDGTVEVDTTLVASAPAGSGPSAGAVVTLVPEGRVVEVRSTTLPVIPTGEYYELWFVGPGDRPGARNRVSAGTWHPAPDGTTDVRFLAAADPAKLGTLEVTREPGDGDPAPTGDVVLRSRPG